MKEETVQVQVFNSFGRKLGEAKITKALFEKKYQYHKTNMAKHVFGEKIIKKLNIVPDEWIRLADLDFNPGAKPCPPLPKRQSASVYGGM